MLEETTKRPLPMHLNPNAGGTPVVDHLEGARRQTARLFGDVIDEYSTGTDKSDKTPSDLPPLMSQRNDREDDESSKESIFIPRLQSNAGGNT